MMNTQAVVHIRKGEARSLKAGGMWIYDNEIERIEGEFENGDILRVEDFDGYPLGCGFINTRSKLTVRMLSRKKYGDYMTPQNVSNTHGGVIFDTEMDYKEYLSKLKCDEN